MIRRLTIAAAAVWTAASLLAVAVWAVVAPALTADEDAEPTCPNLHWDDETCPGCDPGPDDLEAAMTRAREVMRRHDEQEGRPDDLEAVARVTGLVVWPAVPDVEALALAALIDRCIDRLVEGETCPDYYDEIKWGAL